MRARVFLLAAALPMGRGPTQGKGERKERIRLGVGSAQIEKVEGGAGSALLRHEALEGSVQNKEKQVEKSFLRPNKQTKKTVLFSFYKKK